MRGIFILGLMVTMSACSDRAGGGGEGSGSGSSDTDTTDSDSDSDTTDTTVGTTTNTTGPGCADYFNEDPGAFTFTIQNDRDEAIVLGNPVSCQSSLISVDSDSDDVPGSWGGDHCAFTCEEIKGGGCGCDASCPIAAGIRIEPGGHYEVDWDGRVLSPHVLEPECGSQECGLECNILREVPGGIVHRVTIGLVDPTTCLDGACDCTANADGWCQVDGFYDNTEPLPSGFTYAPGQGSVIVVG